MTTETNNSVRKRRFDLGNLAFNIVCYLTIAFLLLPIITVIVTSFTSGQTITFPPKMPLSLKWYTAIFTDQGYVSALKNSLVIASLTVVFSVLVGTLAAAGLTQRSFKGEPLVHTLVFFPFLVP
jgi:ABC-type spermidine/putrescine transport system permease subunit II